MNPQTRLQQPRTRLTRSRVSDVMTRDVITALQDTPYKQLERILAEHHISAIPVVDPDNVPIGIVSEADLLLKAELSERHRTGWSPHARTERSKAAALTAVGLMSTPVVTIEAGSPLAAAARLLRQRAIKRLPVVEHGKLVGIVSRADVLKLYLRPDSEIRSDIIDGAIRGAMWMDPSTIEVSVDDGVVALGGIVERRSEAEILIEVVHGVDGVVSVMSTLSYGFDDRAVEPPTEQQIR